jgi:hypothetical protein
VDITQETQPTVISRETPPESDPTKIDRNSESVRDGRPTTDDSVLEAMDEEFPPLGSQ